MATMSKLAYLKRYMSKEDLEDMKMKNKVKKKVLSDLEKRKTDGDTSVSSASVLKGAGLTQSQSSSSRKPGKKKIKRFDSDSDGSPPGKPAPEQLRKTRHDSDSDPSPVRKPMADPLRRAHHDSDSDQSPPRKSSTVAPDCDQSPPRKPSTTPSAARKRHDSSSDQSPPRKNSRKGAGSDSDQSPPRKADRKRHDSDSDQSPPRKIARKRQDSDSDQSPPRHRKSSPPSSSASSNRRDRPSRFSNLSPPRSKAGTTKATKTMSGATAGLSSAAEMKREAKVLREKEDRSFQKIDEQILGKNAKTVVRDRETGKRRNLQAEQEDDEEKQKKLEAQKEKYQQWGKGMSQQQERDKRLAEQVHEASKPFARYKDDTDLDDMLRQEQRAEDPMLAFIQRKKMKENAAKGGGATKKELPKYKGPTPPPPNRYNIPPGYRWDGVDRSNGFESKLFANINNKKAVQEIAYKWSTEDM